MQHPISACILIVSIPIAAHAQGLITAPQQSVDAVLPIPATNDSLRVAVDGDRMALLRDTFVREAGEWVPSDPLIGTTFAVAGDGGRFVTGNPVAQVARIQSPSPTGWVIDGLLVPGDPRPGLRFGAEVDIDGDVAAVLAPGWRPVGQSGANAVGGVYVFRDAPGGWVQEALLTPAAGDLYDFQNGDARIAIDGDTLVVTGRAAHPGGGFRPCVHVLQRGAGVWSQVTTLTFPNGAADGGVGMFVDVQEDVPGTFASIAVRSSVISRVLTGYGATWQSQDVEAGTWRGPVRFSGSVLALAVRNDDVAGIDNVGAVYLYQRDNAGTWQFESRVVPVAPQQGQHFGADLDLDGGSLAVASGGIGTAFPLNPTVEIFRVLPIAASEYCAGLPSSAGAVARITSTGSTSVAANDLELVAGPVPTSSGLFYYGAVQIQVPFGDGFRCVGANVRRLPQGNVLNGLLTHEVDLGAPAGSGQILPGSTWNFQAWFRDPAASGAGFNLSTGLQLSFQQ